MLYCESPNQPPQANDQDTMSNHSRSSSEQQDLLNWSEVLPAQIQGFLSDFDYNDVQNEVNECLPREYREILCQNKMDRKSQIIFLFWILGCKPQNIPTFLKAISHEDNYDWLVERAKRERDTPSADTLRYAKQVKILRSNNPKHTKYNVRRMKPFMELRTALKKLRPHHPVVLSGELGIGKNWLALDACEEYTVMRAMNFSIYWLNVSECKSMAEDLRKLQQLSILLYDTMDNRPPIECFDDIENRKLNMQQHLKRILNTDPYKNCLLVLQNVQNVKTYQTFNLGCKLLLITRTQKVVDSLSPVLGKHISLDPALTRLEFKCLFTKYLGNQIDKAKAEQIYRNSGGHPYLLSIIGQNLKKDITAWDRWVSNLQNSKEEAALDATHKKLTVSIETSLNHLPEELLSLYSTLAIFPHSTPIPIKLLTQTLWKRKDTRHVLHKFKEISMLTIDNDVCIIPVIFSIYLKKTQPHRIELHQMVIDHYKVNELFVDRTDVLFNDNQLDLYFFNHIGQHLLQADKVNLFFKLYFDFGFLELKIRRVGLLNTYADLKFFERAVEEKKLIPDLRHLELLKALLKFLPKVEEKLVLSKDTCLLQCALWEMGPVYEEAVRQVKQFPHRAWFKEKSSFHQPRQIVNLPACPKSITMLDTDICLVALSQQMLLLDISLDNNSGPIYLMKDEKSKEDIIQMCLFNRNLYMLTLNDYGTMTLWSMADSLSGRRSKREVYHPCSSISKASVVAFDIEELHGTILLHVAFKNGDIRVFQWVEKYFQPDRVPLLATKQTDIHYLSKILGRYYMIVDWSGHVSFWDVRDSHKVQDGIEWPGEPSTVLYYAICNSDALLQDFAPVSIVFVCDKQVLRLVLKDDTLFASYVEILYECADTIKCAKLSLDSRYLVLGTQRGLIVLDTISKSEVLRGNMSQVITCVDIASLDDRTFKYMIIYGAQHKTALHMYGLRQDGNTVSWAHSVSTNSSVDCNEPQLEPGVCLLGQKLYDISYNGDTYVVAADTKRRIHEVCTTRKRKWSTIKPLAETSIAITAITTLKHTTLVGYENGSIFNVAAKSFEVSFTTKPITYLQLMTPNIYVASTQDGLMCVRDFSNDVTEIFDFSIRKCFKVFGHFLLLLQNFGFVTVLDIEKGFQAIHRKKEAYECSPRGCEFKNSRFFVATKDCQLYVYQCSLTGDEFNASDPSIFHITQKEHSEITCLAVTNDASLFAVGQLRHAGRDDEVNIEVYRLHEHNNEAAFLYNLESHISQIYDLRFSPSADVLVSCAEQLCFWSVSYLLNNPLSKNSPKRRSTRFSSELSFEEAEVDAQVIESRLKFLSVNHSNASPWQEIRGPSDKPELLACIKFDGNKSQMIFANDDFTQFNTIDDDGVYVHLALLDVKNDLPATTPTISLAYDARIDSRCFDDTDYVGADIIE